jgi:hypothetical protein
LTAIPKLEGDNKDMEEDNIHVDMVTQRYGLFLYVRTSSISILSNSNLGAVANDLTTLSLIFAS